MEKYIEIKGARVNNLKNISLKIPRNQLITVTGVSGSGKSSLAFDTLYAEGQRRYVESLSSYARQFLGRMSKPECDFIKGLPPAIAIEQKTIARNPRSTVGTSTEIYEYLRLLFARIGRTYSPISGQEVKKHSAEDIVDCTRQYSEGTRFVILAPLHVVEGRTIRRQLEMEIQQGYARLWLNNEPRRIDEYLESTEPENLPADETLWLLIDRLKVDFSRDAISRLTDSAETAMYEGNGMCRLVFLPSGLAYDFSTRFEADGITFDEPSDQMFSFNSPLGACPECEGFGRIIGIDEKLVIPNSSLSVYDGCVQCWHGDKMGMWKDEFCRRAAKDDFPIFKPYYELSQSEKDMLWHGLPSERKRDIHEQVSIDAFFQMVKENQYKIQYRVMLSRYRGKTVCPLCHGTRLKEEATWVKIGGKSIADLVEMPIGNLRTWFEMLELSEHEAEISRRLLTEIKSRLGFLSEVGLNYLTLNRASNTLSGGESQRINLCTSLGSSLVGSLYILDEPSIGLHQRDNVRLINSLKALRDEGNTVIVVEHDKDMMLNADYIVDMGPLAGRKGGEVVFQGTPQEMLLTDTLTSRFLNGKEKIEVPTTRRKGNGKSLRIVGAKGNNLKDVSVDIPLGMLVCVTGVSGSGKSTLINETLQPYLSQHFYHSNQEPLAFDKIEGVENIDKVVSVDQSPLGRTPRSNPATYTDVFTDIRKLFVEMPESKMRAYKPGRFSFNVAGGRCEVCGGNGYKTIQMNFLPDVLVPCEVCHGKRYNRETLEVRFKGKSISDVLDMTINQAVEFFENQPKILHKIKVLQDVGLGYIKLGQPSSTLSGGESQRVKLATELAKRDTGNTLYILDEPTTGLHFEDIRTLMQVLNRLIDKGNTVIVIEHNLDVIKLADHIIDMGPEGGRQGGTVVVTGTPESVAASGKGITAEFLKNEL